MFSVTKVKRAAAFPNIHRGAELTLKLIHYTCFFTVILSREMIAKGSILLFITAGLRFQSMTQFSVSSAKLALILYFLSECFLYDNHQQEFLKSTDRYQNCCFSSCYFYCYSKLSRLLKTDNHFKHLCFVFKGTAPIYR